MFIDTHAHLNDFDAFPDYEQIIAQLANDNIKSVIAIGADIEWSRQAVLLAGRYQQVFACVGTHPSAAGEFCREHYDYYLSEALDNKRVVAIGEAGLDYHYEGYDKQLQAKVFLQHVDLASRAGLPLVVHVRDAYEDTLKILTDNRDRLSAGALLHCFSGSVEYMRQILALGFDIAIGGAVTFKNAKKLVDVAREVPLERLHLETDCPYLCPERGKRNEPKYVNAIAERIAQIKGVSICEVEGNCNANARRLFARIA